jgi:hypothetical protein
MRDGDGPKHTVFLGRFYLPRSHPQVALAEIDREPESYWRLHGQALAYHTLGREKEADPAKGRDGAVAAAIHPARYSPTGPDGMSRP